MELTLESFTHLGRPGLRLAGRLNGNTALQLEQFLAGTEPAPDWWDLSALVFLSSAGLRVLIAHEKRRRRLGVASSTLVGTPAAVREVLELTGLTDFWQLLPALPAAPRDTAAVASPMARGTQVEVAAGAEWLPLPGTHGALVRWREAAGEGAPVGAPAQQPSYAAAPMPAAPAVDLAGGGDDDDLPLPLPRQFDPAMQRTARLASLDPNDGIDL